MECRVCDGTFLERVVDLGDQPWANHFLQPAEVGTEPVYPLRVVYCTSCSTAQLDFTVKKEVMFGDHTYLSGMTRSLDDHFASVAIDVDNKFLRNKRDKSALDIGSNDGTQLKHFQKLGYTVLGVESSKSQAIIANDNGVPTENAFFNYDLSKKINHKFDVINASGVFFHLEELHSVTEGIKNLLGDDGIFVVQFIYMKKIVENLAFDQIYHEHLLYYNLKTIQILLRRHGLEMFDAKLSPIHGGSVIGYVGHANRRQKTNQILALEFEEEKSDSNSIETYRKFEECIREKKEKTMAVLDRYKSHGKRIYGMGAPVKGNTLLNYYKIGRDYLDCLVEKNYLRKGLVSPGMHIPVVLENELEQNPDVYFVLAWNFKNEILARNQDLVSKGVEFYFPVSPSEV